MYMTLCIWHVHATSIEVLMDHTSWTWLSGSSLFFLVKMHLYISGEDKIILSCLVSYNPVYFLVM